MHHVLGQPGAIDTLRRALRSGRLQHAWIFSGPRGIGKFTTAVEFARILLDPAAGPNLAGDIEADPDGRTSRLVDTGAHPDLHVIRKELALVSDIAELRRKKLSNIPIDVLRQNMIGGRTSDGQFHEGPANLTSSLGHGKVFIVDEVELIDANGQHALLKTLEEPPAGTYIILVTSHPERLLPTMHSRCQHVRFGPLDDAAMRAWFERRELSASEDELAWVTAFCDGSPGLAMTALEYGFHAWHRALAPHLAELEAGGFPVAMGEAMAELTASFATAWVRNNRNASKDAANKDATAYLISLLAAYARRRLAEATGDEARRRIEVVELLRDAERQIAGNVNMKQALENLVVQWARVEQAAAV